MRKMIVIAAVLGFAAAANAQSPGQKCHSGKNQEAGKYASCLSKAEAKLLKSEGTCSVTTATICYRDGDCPMGETCTKDTTKYSASVAKCEEKFEGKWTTLTQKAADALDPCPDGLAQQDVKDVLDECIDNVQTGLAGGGLVDCSGDLLSCQGDLGTCNGDLSTSNASLASCTGNLGTCNTNLATCSGDLATANSGTAAVGDVLAGKTFTSTAGLGATGTMPNNGAVTLTPTTSDQAIAAGYHDGSGKCAGDADLVAGNINNGVNLFGVVGTAPSSRPAKSGQTTCYNMAGSVIACAGTGQDGELQKGVAASFTDNGDGTITDNLTGLMWEKLSDDGSIHDKDNSYTWDNAFASKVATLNSGSFAGYNDWRVPNVRELQTLVSFGAANPSTYSAFNTGCVAACTVTTCSCTRSSLYWSSSTSQGGPGTAWGVVFSDGGTVANGKAGGDKVRGVRAGS